MSWVFVFRLPELVLIKRIIIIHGAVFVAHPVRMRVSIF